MPSVRVGIRYMDQFCKSIYYIHSHSMKSINLSYNNFYSKSISKEDFIYIVDDCIDIYNNLNDSDSKNIFIASLRARLDGCFSFFKRSNYSEYYHPLVHVNKNDIVIDGGIWDKQIISKFSEIVGEHGHVYGFEPLSAAYLRSQEQLSDLKNITLENYGLGAEDGSFFITKQGEGSQVVKYANENTETCRITSIDNYISKSNIKKIDMIKLDIERAEPDALRGAIQTINQYTPKLVISIYHKPIEQLIEIPKFILSLDLGYRIYMGHHSEICFCTILYAIKS